ncbi:hypothetical protein P154DRAFT_57256 [Amniculicola lignicola CBS 123094]|uniref:Zn(2)-C6 fungal-type domain-containing protein n=1 Tax=Amniculicola lignicola CBS 123094 TaxID=1392246 RepID=A0A6A5VWK9_9PLEO|nr:hypothetical protein P154DRAFT_57256 [Amniculicola lignicola CBS 123094]
MPQATAKRKFHSKSRRGCFPCKQRHTKCDEIHPTCGVCTRTAVECSWPALPSRASSSQPSPDNVSVPSESGDCSTRNPERLYGGPLTVLPIDDMKLLHHWTAKLGFIHDLDHSPGVRLWSIDIVDIGFKHPFLLHGLLATAAIHKTLKDPQANRTSLLVQADTHISAALAVYMQLLQKPTLETSLPMFLFAALLFTYNVATDQVEEPHQTLDSILHCFRLIQGIKIVITGYWDYLKQLPIVIGSVHGLTDLTIIPLPEGGGFKEVTDLKQLASELDGPNRDVCMQTIENLHLCFLRTQTLLQNGSDDPESNRPKHIHHLFINWAVMLDREFLVLLAAHNPVAIIIVAHYAILVSQARYAWWASGWPERILNTSKLLLDSRPEYRQWLEWPIQQISKSI